MKAFKICLAVLFLAAAGFGCTKPGSQRVTNPTPIPRPGVPQIRDGRWITGESDIREAAARAARSPLVTRAIADWASDPKLSFHPTGVIGAIGTGEDGASVRFTVLPYQDDEDNTHAVYFALVERGGASKVEFFELIRGRHPTPSEIGFLPVNKGEGGIWMKNGPTYELSPAGVVRRAPEKFNLQKFATCFITISSIGLNGVRDGCHAMADFPACVSIGSTAVIVGAALYCAWAAYNS